MRILKLLALAALLPACSGHTVYRFEVDLLSFIPENQRAGSLTVPPGGIQVLLPGQGGQPVSLPGAKALLDGRMQGALEVVNNTALRLTASLEVRVGPAGDQNLFDGDQDVRWGIAQADLNPNETRVIALDLPLDSSAPAVYTLVKSGDFRIGLRIGFSTGAGSVRYALQREDLTLRLKPFNLIPNP